MFKILRKLKACLVLRQAIIEANARYLKTGNRQYVIPSSTSKKLIVTSSIEETHNQGIRFTRVIRPDYKHPATLMNQAIYYTSSRKSKRAWRHSIPPSVYDQRKRFFYKWYCE